MSDYIYGRNPVREALLDGRPINVIYILAEGRGQSLVEIVKLAQKAGILIKKLSREELASITRHSHHQGVVAQVEDYVYADLDDMLQLAKQMGEPSLVAILDGVQDPHNLGAIIRSADGAGLHGIVIARHHAVAVNPTVVKAAAGATTFIKIARVVNLVQTINALKHQGVWIVGTSGDGNQSYLNVDYTLPTAIVLGSEGKGIRRLVRESCDFLVHIPMYGRVNSLNVSVSAALMFFEARRQRKK